MSRLNPKQIQILKRFGYAAVCCWVLLIGVSFFWLKQSPVLTKAVTRQVEQAVGIEPADPFEGKDHLTILVLGCDSDLSRGGKKVLKKYARSDMMLVARLDFRSKQITGISIPRDTLVAAGTYGDQKINAYHAYGGKDLAKLAVQTLLPGITIDRVIVLDFEAFQDMVNTVGGVEVNVTKRMKWTDKAAKLYIDLKPGKQKLDGYNAMGFVRFRHTDSDLYRTDRQRQFLLAFKQAVFANPLKLPEVVNKATAVLNGAMTDDELVALADFARQVGNDRIKMGVLPTMAADGYNLRVDQTKLAETLLEYRLTDVVSVS